MLRLEKNGENAREKMGRVKTSGGGGGEREDFFSPPPPLFPPFALVPTLTVTIFTLRNLPPSYDGGCNSTNFRQPKISQTTEATETIPPKLLSNIVYNLQIFHREHHS